MKVVNKKRLLLKRKATELTPDELEGRKKARVIHKSLMKNQNDKEDILDMIADDMDEVRNGNFFSQEFVDRYHDIYMDDDEK